MERLALVTANAELRPPHRALLAARHFTGRLGPWLSRVAGSPARGRLGILTWHRIHDPVPGLPPATWNVTPERFRAQIEGLLERGYQPWPLSKALEAHRAGHSAPARSFVVTFDDAYENVYHHAWPVLRQWDVPCTIFLATAYLDSQQPFPFDDWSGSGMPAAPAESWRPLSTAQCREMRSSGLVELGCHTHTHQDFRGRPDALRADIESSLTVLRERFGIEAAPFALPYGSKEQGFADAALRAAARRTGVTCTLTTHSELVDPRSDPFDWGRFDVAGSDTADLLASKLDGWYGLARGVWRGAQQSVRALRGRDAAENRDSCLLKDGSA